MPVALPEPATNSPPRILDRYARASAYRADRPAQPIDLWLDMNESPAPSAAAVRALRDLAGDEIRRYPSARELEALFARTQGVDAESVLATAGGDDGIDRVCRVLLEGGRTMVTHTPGFSMIEKSARNAGAEVRCVEWDLGEFPLEALLDAIDETAGLVALVSPNNPTGRTIEAESIAAVAHQCARVGAGLLVDAAYAEFADEDPTRVALALPNTVVVRTLSKAFGLAGARVGFLLGEAAIVRACRSAGGPFAVSGPSIVAGIAVLNDDAPEGFSPIVGARRERTRLGRALRALGVASPESQANFVYARMETPARAAWLRDALRGLGVSIRAWGEDAALADAVRITCPCDADACDRVIHGMGAALAPEALLLDLDGVLADVSRSYREAIVRTCAMFGVEITRAEIDALKARGNANNDWLVTRELLCAQGVEVPLDAVIERFESVYHGNGELPGLRERESLLTSVETLRSLAARTPLAIVTGRPRADAERFLDRFGVASLFGATVCMEDGPSKPDPAVVRTTMERLGAQRAWMVGDTVDDVRAARAAGVIPLAISAPQDAPERVGSALLRAGAARMLTTVEELLEMLP